MNVVKATRQYEQWLGAHLDLIPRDLRLKHRRMAEGAFSFLRATFYRWAQLWPKVCPELARAPHVLAVGDLHIENFGTWRDLEGRLIWGVNDFDEAAPLAYTNDLVRLAVSAMLMVEEGNSSLKAREICDELLAGYRQCLDAGGHPFVLEEGYPWLRHIAVNELRNPDRFWEKMNALRTTKELVPASAREALLHWMPESHLPHRIVHRVAGLGSLGRQRFVALAEYRGGKVAREAKALAPSAVHWAKASDRPAEILYHAVISQAVRCPDPFVQLHGRWIVRRLSPYCSRIELTMLPGDREECRLLSSMGWETGNVHLGSAHAIKPLRKHLKKSKPTWLLDAATLMTKAVQKDWDIWRKAIES